MNNENVWLANPLTITTIKHYYLEAIDSKRHPYYQHPQFRKFSQYIEKTEDPEILNWLEAYHKDALALSIASHSYVKADHLPDRLWTEDSETELPTPADYVFGINDGHIILNEDCARVLQQFRLGETTLTPLHIYDIETGQQLSNTTYYFLNLNERREYIKFPQSDPIFDTYTTMEKRLKYSTGGVTIKDQVLKVHKAALECDVDLWHDPLLLGRIFFSDALHKALTNANMIDKWETVTCQLV